MKIAYLIQCHKNFDQIIFLVNSLCLTDVDNAVIHVDLKNPELKLKLINYFSKMDNVTIIDNPISVHWSGVSQLEATFKMIKLLHTKDIYYDYCCLLSGEDGVLDVDALKKCLAIAYPKSFIDFRNDKERYLWRINKFNFFRNNRYSRTTAVRLVSKGLILLQKLFLVKRDNFKSDEIFIGSQWFVISRPQMKKVIDIINPSFLERFRYTSCSDEHFFQMLFKANFKNDEFKHFNLTYTHFNEGDNSPRYLTCNDLDKVRTEGNCFFARKIVLSVYKEYLKK